MNVMGIVELETRVILYHLLKREEFTYEGISYDDLDRLKDSIKDKLDEMGIVKRVYPLLDKRDLDNAVERSPGYFIRTHADTIARTENSDHLYEENDKFFQFNPEYVPKYIADIAMRAIAELEKA